MLECAENLLWVLSTQVAYLGAHTMYMLTYIDETTWSSEVDELRTS